MVGLDDPAPRELDRLRLTLPALAPPTPPAPPNPPMPVPAPLSSSSGGRPLRLSDPEASLAGLGGAGVLATPPRRPLAPLRNLLCMGLSEGSASGLAPPPAGTGVLDAPRPLLARPLGALDSASLVGESQNLGGAQS